MKADRCSQHVKTDGMSMHFHQCCHAGTVKRDGETYCGIHDPVAVKARRHKRDAKWNAEQDAKRARWAQEHLEDARAALCVAACQYLSDGDLRRLVKINRCDIVAFIAKNL